MDVVHVPVCFCELRRVASDEDGALALLLEGGAATSPSSITEVTAEGGVKDDSVVGEVGIDVAARAIEDGVRKLPSRRVRATRCNVGRN